MIPLGDEPSFINILDDDEDIENKLEQEESKHASAEVSTKDIMTFASSSHQV